MSTIGQQGPAESLPERVFGAENRARMLSRYFENRGPISAGTAWQDVYRLLLWIDRTTGLAHCYESDKCQPGRPWYARSLAFHDWVSGALGTTPAGLANEIDLLFKQATADLASAAAGGRTARTVQQRMPYEGRGFPHPGEDSELEAILTEYLAVYLAQRPPVDVLRDLTQRIQAHLRQENKRKNLVGEGFEDTVAALLNRVPGISGNREVLVRPNLHEIPGFYPPREGDKTRQVDLALVDRRSGERILISCKWSIRADREEQFRTDFEAYSRLESANRHFGYVLITNEFDPARLAAACDMSSQNSGLFDDVVHVNPTGPAAAYGVEVTTSSRRDRGGVTRATQHIESGRLGSLEAWLVKLGARG